MNPRPCSQYIADLLLLLLSEGQRLIHFADSIIDMLPLQVTASAIHACQHSTPRKHNHSPLCDHSNQTLREHVHVTRCGGVQSCWQWLRWIEQQHITSAAHLCCGAGDTCAAQEPSHPTYPASLKPQCAPAHQDTVWPNTIHFSACRTNKHREC